ncbi:MAG TPA: DNRLRE domain-containing protein [Polyangiaceae bacterium]|nr:DNRLRE domain-containing protein [Polyangiaceae bacterium]
MPLPSRTVGSLWCLGLLGAFSCAVFPDEATLPGGSAGEAGEDSGAGKGTAGTSVLPSGGSSSTAGTGMLLGGTSTDGGVPPTDAGAPPLGEGGTTTTPGGAGGAGGTAGTPSCADPQERVIAVSADTWIEAAKPSAGHGNDQQLFIIGGGQERRALFELTLPAAPAGAVLLKATFGLRLESNAAVGLAERRLQVRELSQAVNEGSASWNNWGNGSSRKWMLPGGDFGPVLASTRVPASTGDGPVTFDVTAPVAQAFAADPVVLSFIVMENGAPPAAPAELAFTSSEGDASGVPTLTLQYCEP